MIDNVVDDVTSGGRLFQVLADAQSSIVHSWW